VDEIAKAKCESSDGTAYFFSRDEEAVVRGDHGGRKVFNESNTVEAYVRDLLAGPIKAVPANTAQEPQASYGPSPKGIGWRYAALLRCRARFRKCWSNPGCAMR
jgi:type I restriction enzyme R subunit